MSSHDQDPLDANLAKLLERAPERERLSSAARERIQSAARARLEETARERADVLRPEHTEPLRPRPLRSRPILVAAAALLLAALGAFLYPRLAGMGGASPDRTTPEVARTDAPTPDALQPGEQRPGEQRDRGEWPESREEGPSQPELADSGLRPEAPENDSAGDLVGAVRIARGATPGAEVVVWARPLVELPRVAEAQRFVVGAAGDGATELPFALDGIRERAAAAGAPRILVQAEVERFGVARVILDAGSTEAPTLDVAGGASVRGVVVSVAGGVPIEGALVFPIDALPVDALPVDVAVTDDLPRPFAVTDSAGRFELVGVPAGAPPALRASSAGFAPSFGDARTEPDGSFVARLELGPGGAFEGVVERPDGTREAGALVVASKSLDEEQELRGRTTMTFGGAEADGNGVYRIEHLPPGPHVVLVLDRNGAGGPPSRMRFAVAAAGEVTRVDFVSSPTSVGHALAGTLRGSDGAPVAGVGLTFGSSLNGSDWSATTTGPDGSFLFEDLERTNYTLLLAEDDFRSLSALWWGDVAGPTELDLTLTDTRVQLLPQRADGTEAVAVWRMLEYEDPRAPAGWSFAGSAVGPPAAGSGAAGSGAAGLGAAGLGEPTFRGLPPGRYRGAVAPADGLGLGYGFTEARTLERGELWTQNVTLPPGGALSVLVRDGSGAAVSGASVDVVVPDAGRSVPTRTPTRTDAEGAASVPLVPFGRVEVRATLGGQSALESAWFDAASKAIEVVLQ